MLSQFSDLNNTVRSKATNVFTHIFAANSPNNVLNVYFTMPQSSTVFLLFADAFNNVFIFHASTAEIPTTLTDITETYHIVWISKPAQHIYINMIRYDTGYFRIKLSYRGSSGIPVTSITQLDNGTENLFSYSNYVAE